ncbi:hypothetical protein QBC34DRAFT_89947 [Podospora aff. communis PSN243]|uniref:Uncharacterized protein n=1 Tax=Podospora aff. communis PSN243 TaxID=3040156 RepID=A0AAV9GMF0_9PEZI|nr:hypothetical protein QBC34DRAFT_89947 [Podospora aff. communis PSN243]
MNELHDTKRPICPSRLEAELHKQRAATTNSKHWHCKVMPCPNRCSDETSSCHCARTIGRSAMEVPVNLAAIIRLGICRGPLLGPSPPQKRHKSPDHTFGTLPGHSSPPDGFPSHPWTACPRLSPLAAQQKLPIQVALASETASGIWQAWIAHRLGGILASVEDSSPGTSSIDTERRMGRHASQGRPRKGWRLFPSLRETTGPQMGIHLSNSLSWIVRMGIREKDGAPHRAFNW